MPEELQKDPLTRGQFLWMGVLSTFIGAVLTIPPVVYFLSPSIKSVLQERSDVPEEWKELGSVFDVPAHKVVVQLVEFTQRQTYDSGQPGSEEGSIMNAALLSWRDGELPGFLQNRSEGPFSSGETEELGSELNVMSNACTHMGCPVRWSEEEGEIQCPCHGGIYDINGEHMGGPPPHDLWRYTFRVREDGGILVKHEFVGGKPYVV